MLSLITLTYLYCMPTMKGTGSVMVGAAEIGIIESHSRLISVVLSPLPFEVAR